ESDRRAVANHGPVRRLPDRGRERALREPAARALDMARGAGEIALADAREVEAASFLEAILGARGNANRDLLPVGERARVGAPRAQRPRAFHAESVPVMDLAALVDRHLEGDDALQPRIPLRIQARDAPPAIGKAGGERAAVLELLVPDFLSRVDRHRSGRSVR